MRFTKYNSMEDILKYPDMDKYLKIFYSEYLLSMYPENMKTLPIARVEQAAKTPWQEPFSIVADQLMDAVNLVLDLFENHTRRAVSLWDPRGGDWNLEKEEKGGKEKVFLIAPALESVKERKPGVIICPGGGYEEVCFSGEGTPIMHYMEAKGYRAFILRYRVGKDGVYPAPQADLALGIKYIRAHAEEYGVDPEDILILGASAGGHLCAAEAALYKEAGDVADRELEPDYPQSEAVKRADPRPDKVCLCYPVISFLKEPHEGSAQALTGGQDSLREKLSAENLVTPDYPPAFVWTCADDDCVPPSNAVRMGEALERSGVRHQLHIYPSGGHGCALAFSKEAWGWSQAMTEFFRDLSH